MIQRYPVDPCRRCNGRNFELRGTSNYHVFFCVKCRLFARESYPFSPGIGVYFDKKTDTWAVERFLTYKCKICGEIFSCSEIKHTTENKSNNCCPNCVLTRYFAEVDGKCTCITCNKEIRPNFYGLFLKFDIYSRRNFANRYLRHHTMIENIQGIEKILHGENPENFADIGKRQVIITACNRKCVGKYQRLLFKNVSKHLWILDRIKMICKLCNRVEVLSLSDHYFDMERREIFHIEKMTVKRIDSFYCRECLE